MSDRAAQADREERRADKGNARNANGRDENVRREPPGARRRPGRGAGRKAPIGPLLRECPTPYRQESGQVIAVLRYRNGGRTVLWPDRREDYDKPLLRGPFTAFEVALGRHVTEFGISLPAAGDAEFFEAEARVHWEVEDPSLVVDRQVWDAAELLRDDLLERLRDVSRQYALTEAERVDRAVRAELVSGRFALGEDLGLRTKVHVFIDLSERVADREREHTDLEHELRVSGRREEWESRRVAARAEEFEQMLRRGNIGQIAGFMAREPGRELEIRNLIRQEWREEQQVSIELFSRMLDSGHLERHDIGEHMYEVIQYLRSRSGGVVGNTMDQVLAPRLPAGRLPPSDGAPHRPPPFWAGDDGPEAAPGARGPNPGSPDSPDDRDDRDDREDRVGRGGAARPGGRASDDFDDWDA
ncbi:hypothetical protein [Streptomyces profundus]|uniref:hypothetical protein n=1 Tax=Streptomyces profundus TaxID=2867410 RepID=UPI001D168778|nr:hypothetical protein [Streptomyces sp. MA3_2.13]UED85542.1 hypothetical protein K4G22_16195 [Streptomyces sp. MA3_2.13]